jgi:hypothetical protein
MDYTESDLFWNKMERSCTLLTPWGTFWKLIFSFNDYFTHEWEDVSSRSFGKGSPRNPVTCQIDGTNIGNLSSRDVNDILNLIAKKENLTTSVNVRSMYPKRFIEKSREYELCGY